MAREYEYGPTGGLFDFNRDGKLNFFEKNMEFEFMESFLKEDEDDEEDGIDLDSLDEFDPDLDELEDDDFEDADELEDDDFENEDDFGDDIF